MRALAIAIFLTLAGCAASTVEEEQPAAAGSRTFCELVEDVNALYSDGTQVQVDHTMSDAEIDRRVRAFEDRLDAIVARGDELFRELAISAPETLASDIAVLHEDAMATAQLMREAAGDPIALMQAPRPFTAAQVADAHRRVDAHTREACGVGFGPPPDLEPADALPSGPSAPPEPPPPPAPPEPPGPPEPPAPPE